VTKITLRGYSEARVAKTSRTHRRLSNFGGLQRPTRSGLGRSAGTIQFRESRSPLPYQGELAVPSCSHSLLISLVRTTYSSGNAGKAETEWHVPGKVTTEETLRRNFTREFQGFSDGDCFPWVFVVFGKLDASPKRAQTPKGHHLSECDAGCPKWCILSLEPSVPELSQMKRRSTDQFTRE
jgi:hypothetical protein